MQLSRSYTSSSLKSIKYEYHITYLALVVLLILEYLGGRDLK